MNLGNALMQLVKSTGFMTISIGQIIMMLVSFILLYLAIEKKYEPLLLLPIAFGMLLTNFPGTGITDGPIWDPNDPDRKSVV